MEITDIKIRRCFKTGPMKAVVSVTFDSSIAVHDIKVVYAGAKYFAVMPSYKTASGTYRDIIHPINSEFRTYLEEAVLNEYYRVAAEIEAAEEADGETGSDALIESDADEDSDTAADEEI